MDTPFTPSLPSIVRSIRQRDLLNCWLRLVRFPGVLPRHTDFQPSRGDDELVDMMVFEVVRTAAGPRYLIRHEGVNLTHAYGSDPALRNADPVRFLDDVIGSGRYANVVAFYQTCLDRRRPIYSVSMVKDQDGKDVAYERLLLPFGNACEVDVIVGSYKTISIEGGFKIRNIMSLEAGTPVTVIRAMIEMPPVAPELGENCNEIIDV